MYPRPKSCSSRALQFGRMRHAFDIADQTPPKRSNSMQNLDNVRGSKDRNLGRKPRLAWVRQACSQENEVEVGRVAIRSPDAVFGQNEKWTVEDSKRKSIDIFLARNFIDPVDVMPAGFKIFGSASGKKPPSSTRDDRLFVPAAAVAIQGAADNSSESGFSNLDGKRTENGPQSCRTEKRVTFANDLPNRRIDAETRRLHFRNSYSKIGKSRSAREKQNSLDETPSVRFSEYGSWAERTPEVDGEKHSYTSANLSKQSSIKRKLKSCRSRSFHKSLDSSSAVENIVETYSYAQPSRRTQAEVVTMVSLLTSCGEPELDIEVPVENRLNDKEIESKPCKNLERKCKEVKSDQRDDRVKSGISGHKFLIGAFWSSFVLVSTIFTTLLVVHSCLAHLFLVRFPVLVALSLGLLW